MASLINKIKEKTSSNNNNDEQSFTIQPHPAKTNDPKDVESPQLGAGLNSNPEYQAHHARGPHVPSQDILNSLGSDAPSREELHARGAELNQK